jgi:hypothetical protein
MSKLEEISVTFRKTNVARNSYDNNTPYNVAHSNALSNGDEKGKGEVNNQVGGITDIKTREASIVRNKYNRNREYNDATA